MQWRQWLAMVSNGLHYTHYWCYESVIKLNNLVIKFASLRDWEKEIWIKQYIYCPEKSVSPTFTMKGNCWTKCFISFDRNQCHYQTNGPLCMTRCESVLNVLNPIGLIWYKPNIYCNRVFIEKKIYSNDRPSLKSNSLW